jgi:mRNA interferase RelE/StbE
MAYAIRMTRPAQRQLRKLDRPVQRRISASIDGLADNPRPPGVIQLKGDHDPPLFRIRVGDYRIIYTIEDDKLVILIVRISHRSTAYD